MRSAIGPVLVLLGLATTVVLTLLLFGSIGIRADLETMRGELDAMRAAIEAPDRGVSNEDLAVRLEELESAVDDLVLRTGGARGESPRPDDQGDVADRLDEILDRIEALDDRIDEICGNVPVC